MPDVNGISATSGGSLAPPPSTITTNELPNNQPLVEPPITVDPTQLLAGGVFANLEMLAKGRWIPSSTLVSIPVDANATAGNVVFNLGLINDHTSEPARLLIMMSDRFNVQLEYCAVVFSASTIIGGLTAGVTAVKLDSPTLQDLAVIDSKLIKVNDTLQFTVKLGMTTPPDGITRNFLESHPAGMFGSFPDPATLDYTVFPHFVMIQNAPLKANISSALTSIDVRIYSRMAPESATSIYALQRITNIFNSLVTTSSNSLVNATSYNGQTLGSIFGQTKMYLSTDGLYQLGFSSTTNQINYAYGEQTINYTSLNPTNLASFEHHPDLPITLMINAHTADATVSPTASDAITIVDSTSNCFLTIKLVSGTTRTFMMLEHSHYVNPFYTRNSVPINFLTYGDSDIQLDLIGNAATVAAYGHNFISPIAAAVRYIAGVGSIVTTFNSEFINNLVSAMMLGYTSVVSDCTTVFSQQIEGIVNFNDLPQVGANYQLTIGDTTNTSIGNVTPVLTTNGIRMSTETLVTYYFPWYSVDLVYSETGSMTGDVSKQYLIRLGTLSVDFNNLNYILSFYNTIPTFTNLSSIPETYTRIVLTLSIPPNVTTSYTEDGFPSVGSLIPIIPPPQSHQVFLFDLVTPDNNQRIMSVGWSGFNQALFAIFPTQTLFGVLNYSNAANLVIRNMYIGDIGSFPNMSMPIRLLSRVQTGTGTDTLITPNVTGSGLTTVKRRLVNIVKI